MKWDEVEREFYVIGAQLQRLSVSFQALARALQRERESARMAPMTEGHGANERTEIDPGGHQPPLPL